MEMQRKLAYEQLLDWVDSNRMLVPLDGQVLHLTILVIQRSDHGIDGPRGRVVVMLQEVSFVFREDLIQVVQRHESKVGVGIVQLPQQLVNRLGVRVVDSSRHDDALLGRT